MIAHSLTVRPQGWAPVAGRPWPSLPSRRWAPAPERRQSIAKTPTHTQLHTHTHTHTHIQIHTHTQTQQKNSVAMWNLHEPSSNAGWLHPWRGPRKVSYSCVQRTDFQSNCFRAAWMSASGHSTTSFLVLKP